jgi:hypothetical protein
MIVSARITVNQEMQRKVVVRPFFFADWRARAKM